MFPTNEQTKPNDYTDQYVTHMDQKAENISRKTTSIATYKRVLIQLVILRNTTGDHFANIN